MTDRTDLSRKLVKIRETYTHNVQNILSNIEKIEEQYTMTCNFNFKPQVSFTTKAELQKILESYRRSLVNQMLIELRDSTCQASLEVQTCDKKVKRFSRKIIDTLEESYRSNKYPSDEEKLKIANICMISTKQVNNWFTNKRNRNKPRNIHMNSYRY